MELHDCFSINELLTYEALGMCEDGGAASSSDGATRYGGRWVVNPSGGLISKGHPLGATGIAQAAELAWQLRGEAGAGRCRARGSGSPTTSAWAARRSSGFRRLSRSVQE